MFFSSITAGQWSNCDWPHFWKVLNKWTHHLKMHLVFNLVMFVKYKHLFKWTCICDKYATKLGGWQRLCHSTVPMHGVMVAEMWFLCCFSNTCALKLKNLQKQSKLEVKMCQTQTYCVLSLIAGVKIIVKTSVLHHKVLTILVSYNSISTEGISKVVRFSGGGVCVCLCPGHCRVISVWCSLITLFAFSCFHPRPDSGH